MIELTREYLPAFANYNDTPFLIYVDEKNDRAVAVNDRGVISTKLPEIIHEGTEITKEEFKVLAEKRNQEFDGDDEYKKVLYFADSL